MSYYTYQAFLTPDEEGGYDVEVPALPGCFTYGETYAEAATMALDAMRTYVASLLLHGDTLPSPTFEEPKPGTQAMLACFETEPGDIVEGEVISAAEASRRLGVTPGRITHMLSSGVLTGYRRGRRTYISVESVKQRLAQTPKPGRPHASSKA